MIREMKNEKGLTLIEVVIAIGILGIVAAAFMAALAGASRALFIADERATAESLARTQMEYVKSQPYNSNNGTYDTMSGIPTGYTVYGFNQSVPTLFAQYWNAINHTVSANETGIQKITVTVGHNNKPAVITLVDYKARRY